MQGQKFQMLPKHLHVLIPVFSSLEGTGEITLGNISLNNKEMAQLTRASSPRRQRRWCECSWPSESDSLAHSPRMACTSGSPSPP